MESRPIAIVGTGIAVPETILESSLLDHLLGIPEGESFRITGVRKRHIAKDETASQLAAQAVRAAMEHADLEWDEVDCLVCASATMDQALPYNAAMVLAELNENPTHRITSMDVGASCLSFLQALDLLSLAVTAGRFRTVVIVSSDISSFTVDYHNLHENGIFGDGAAAVIIRCAKQGEPSRILAVESITLPEGIDFCQIRSGGSRFHRRGTLDHANAFFQMRGRPLFALVAKELPSFVDRLLEKAGVSAQELAFFVPHQASRLALDHVKKMLGFNDGRAVDIFGEYGNQVGASLPTALHFAIHRYGLQRGQKVLMLGTGAGVTIGGVVIEY